MTLTRWFLGLSLMVGCDALVSTPGHAIGWCPAGYCEKPELQPLVMRACLESSRKSVVVYIAENDFCKCSCTGKNEDTGASELDFLSTEEQ